MVSLAEKRKIVGDKNVTIDLSLSSKYSEFSKRGIYHELYKGVREFNPKTLEQWFHEDFLSEGATGQIILDYFTVNGLFEDCLGFHELEGIQKKGLSFFREHFEGKAVFGWRAVLAFPNGDYRVPYLIEYLGEVVLCLYWVGALWHENFIALRFTKNAHIYTPARNEVHANNVFRLRRNAS